ncbi:MAG TPA: 3-ketoacyl-ACP reductase [Aggregatilineales bacterium]|nr:3-ketoacyl-ACP reductase [Aggregatilineales bacterium]
MADGQRVALVTGGSRGIGRGIALALGQHGWTVMVNYRGNAEAAQATVDDIMNAGGMAETFQADIGQMEDHQRLVETILQGYGRIDLLVNNAGMAPRQRMDILETSEASYDEVMGVNLKGPFFLTQLISRKMIELMAAERVTAPLFIINIGSISAYTSSPNRAEYCLSKAGMGMMTALFADRLSEHGILVYEIRPGVIATDMTGAVSEKYDRLIADGLTPIRRWGQPEDIGKAVIAIVDGLFPFSTGEIINVDGGFHMHRL